MYICMGLPLHTCTCTIHKYMSLNDMGKYMALNENESLKLIYYVSWSELGGMQKKKKRKNYVHKEFITNFS